MLLYDRFVIGPLFGQLLHLRVKIFLDIIKFSFFLPDHRHNFFEGFKWKAHLLAKILHLSVFAIKVNLKVLELCFCNSYLVVNLRQLGNFLLILLLVGLGGLKPPIDFINFTLVLMNIMAQF